MKSETQSGKYIHNTPDGRLVPRVYDEEMGTEQGPQWTNARAGAQSVLRKDSSDDPHTQARKSPGQPTDHLAAPSGQLPSLKPRRLSKERVCCLRCNPWFPPQRLRWNPVPVGGQGRNRRGLNGGEEEQFQATARCALRVIQVAPRGPGASREEVVFQGLTAPFCWVAVASGFSFWTVSGGVPSRCSHVQLCDPMDCSPPGSSVHGVL